MAIKRISANLLGGNAVTAASIAGGAISAADIADNSITAAKLSASTSPTFGGLSVSTTANQVSTFTSTDANARIAVTDSTDTGYFIVNSGILSIGQSLTTSNDLNIDSSGNVGIGTDSPGYQLDLRRNDTGTTPSLGIRQIGTGDASMAFQTTTSPYGFIIGVDASDSEKFKFSTGLSDVAADTKLTIDTSGNVGIGIDTPIYKLHLRSTSSSILNLDSRDTTTGAADTGAGILFTGHDGVNGRDQARIASAKTNSTSGNYSADLVFSTRYNGYGVAEKMRLYDEGNLEIKNIADNGLTLNKQVASTWNYIEFENQGTRSHYIGTDSSNTFVLGSSGPDFYFTGGKVGVGESSPDAILHTSLSTSNGSYGRSLANSNLILENTNTSVTESGYLHLVGYTGNATAQYQMGAIGAGKQTTAADGDYGSFISFWNTSGGANGEANSGMYERMRIDSAGNVVIGNTVASSGKLTIESDDATETGAGGLILNTTNSSLRIGGTSGRSWIQSHGGQPLYINKVGNNIFLNLDSGNVCVGSGSSTDKFSVHGTSLFNGNTYVGSTSSLYVPTAGTIKTYSGGTTFTAMTHTLSQDSNNNMIRFGQEDSNYPAILSSADIRSPSSDDFQDRGIQCSFTSYALNNTSQWADMIVLNTYGDSSGGGANAFVINKSSNGVKIARTSWNTSSNFSSGDIYTLDYTSASDSRVKENVQNITNGLDLISQLRPVTYEWTDEYILSGASKNANENIWNQETESLEIPEIKTTNVGLIAQEVESIIPTVVHEDLISIPGVEGGPIKNISYEKLVPHLISAIKELKQRVEELEG